MERYDPVANQWSSMSPMNNLRDGACVVADDSNIFAITGFDGNSYLSTMDVYDPSKDVWTSEGTVCVLLITLFCLVPDNFAHQGESTNTH